jgi:hypothetical protein
LLCVHPMYQQYANTTPQYPQDSSAPPSAPPETINSVIVSIF